MTTEKSNRSWMSGTAHQDIVTIGDLRLRTEAKVVPDWTTVLPTCDRMVGLLRELKGAGLAATQLGIALRIVVVEVRKTDLFPDRPESGLFVLINPELLEQSGKLEDGWEGCFSVPGLMGIVPRYRNVRIRYTDVTGGLRDETFDGYLARVLQHEIDHLEGSVFLDRMGSMISLTTVANYVKYHHPQQE